LQAPYWWTGLSEVERESITASASLPENAGPNLRYPHTSGINGSRHDHMRELRVQHAGRPYRVLFAFDPRRYAIFLIGGLHFEKNSQYKSTCDYI
jgi:hypothetical protein